jgi:glycosyltransferase involved in cell wall biosynthesis
MTWSAARIAGWWGLRSVGRKLRPVSAVPEALEPRDVVLIHPSGIGNRSRVLKIGRSLLESGHSVAFFAKLPPGAGHDDVLVGEVMGCPVLYFPDAHRFLRAARTRVAALNWPFMIQYLNAAMWHYVRAIGPRVLYTFDTGAIGLGHDLRDRLRAEGRPVSWVHDFTEHTGGHRYCDNRVAGDRPDEEWRRVATSHEAAHVHHPDHRVTVSPALAEVLAAEYGVAPPTVIMNVPRRSDSSAPSTRTVRSMLKLGPDVPLLIYAGGATPLRGLHTLVAALARLDGIHLALVIQGRTPYVRSLAAQARDGGCAHRLHFLPYRPPSEVAGFMRDATIGIHPMERYGNGDVALPNKLFDYLHAGLPVVVSDCPAMADFVTTNALGGVFRAGDVDSLVTVVRATLAEAESLRQGIAGRPELVERYSWESEEKVLAGIFADLLGRDAGPGAGGAQ